jgi:hypothetical protein
VSFIFFETLGTNKVLSLAVFDQIEPINSNWGVSFHSILVTITQIEIRFKTKASHKHMVVIYHRNTPLPKVRKGLDRYIHTATSSSCARQTTHGDKLLHCATDHRGGFAVCFLSIGVCPWHTATTRIPVVHVMDYFNGGFSYFQEGFYSNEISILW